MKTKLHAWALVGLLLAGCGAAADQDIEVTESEERRVALAGRTLAFEGYSGSVMIVGRKDSTATLQFEKRARGADDEAARSHLAGITIETREHGETYTVRLESDQADKTSVGLRAQVPYRTPLRLELGNGLVEVEVMTAPIQVELGNGPVRIKGAANNVDVRVDNGDLTVGMAGFRAETAVRLQTGNGAIDLTLPASAAAAVEAQTQVGAIDVRGLTLSGRAEEKSATGGRLTGVLGDGSGRIELLVKNGSITLRSGQ